jgi:hypothetical protein
MAESSKGRCGARLGRAALRAAKGNVLNREARAGSGAAQVGIGGARSGSVAYRKGIVKKGDALYGKGTVEPSYVELSRAKGIVMHRPVGQGGV